jgi:Tol biopolymer transport system component
LVRKLPLFSPRQGHKVMTTVRTDKALGPILLLFALFLFGITTQAQIEVVSSPYANIANTFGESSAIELSGDGKWAVFSSAGNGLVTNDNNGFFLDLFLKNLKTDEIKLISRGTSGTAANGDSLQASLTEDGRFIVFESDAADLVPGDDNETSDIFLYDRTNGSLRIISKSDTGELGDGDSADAVMTSDGRFILFDSDSDNLSDDASDGQDNLYLYDSQSGTLELVTYRFDGLASASTPDTAGFSAFDASLSNDGRFVAFMSAATNLVSGSVFSGLTTIAPQIYVRDMQNQTNILLTKTTAGKATILSVASPVISENGASVAFLTGATNLTSPATSPIRTSLYIYDTASQGLAALSPPKTPTTSSEFSSPVWNADGHFLAYVFDSAVYLWDTVLQTNKLIFVTTNGLSDSPLISADGRFITYTSTGTDLQENPVSGAYFQLFVYDRQENETRLLSPNQGGSDGANRDILFPALSANGQVAGFTTFATDLVANDSKLFNDVFTVLTTNGNSISLVSVPSPLVVSATANSSSDVEERALSADGRMIVFSSSATDLVPNDENDAIDIFVRDLESGVTHLVSVAQDGVHSVNGPSLEAVISANGRFVAFTSSASNIVSLGRPGNPGLYVYDIAAGTNQLASISPSGEVLIKASKPVLSADGTRVAFFGTLSNSSGVKNELYLRDLVLQTTLWSTNADQIASLVISPNGESVAFSSGGSSTKPLIVYNAIDGSQMRVGAGTGRIPISFSPDGSVLLGTTTGSGPTSPLALFESTTTNITRIATNYFGGAAWSSDGSTLMYVARSGTNYALDKYDVVTGTTNTLQLPAGTDLGRPRGNLALSGNGKVVSFATIPSGSFFPIVLVYDTEAQTVVNASANLAGAVAQYGASTVSMSSDGKMVAFESGSPDLVLNDRNLLGDVFVFQRSSTSNGDSDHDGLDDTWEMANFGNLAANPSEDADQDGLSNLQEYLNGTDPKDAGSVLAFTGSVKGDGALTLNWKSTSGKKYQLQHKADLGAATWEDVGFPVTAGGSSANSQVQMNTTGSEFYRIKLVE